LWAFLVTAAGTGGAVTGMAVMAAFWAGTVPALVAVGLGLQIAGAPLRKHAPAVTAVLLVALGIFAIFTRPASVDAAIKRHSHSAHETPSTQDAPPCCS
jgi:sulfite exporter TauE/SafE